MKFFIFEGGYVMKKSYKKLIAPILIVAILVIYFGIYLYFVITQMTFVTSIPLILKIIATIIPLAFIGVSIFVLIERIKEIRSGEEDDLSKY